MTKFKAIALCAVLQLGVFCGAPIRPVDIERALKLNQNAAVQVMDAELPARPLPELLPPESPER